MRRSNSVALGGGGPGRGISVSEKSILLHSCRGPRCAWACCQLPYPFNQLSLTDANSRVVVPLVYLGPLLCQADSLAEKAPAPPGPTTWPSTAEGHPTLSHCNCMASMSFVISHGQKGKLPALCGGLLSREGKATGFVVHVLSHVVQRVCTGFPLFCTGFKPSVSEDSNPPPQPVNTTLKAHPRERRGLLFITVFPLPKRPVP